MEEIGRQDVSSYRMTLKRKEEALDRILLKTHFGPMDLLLEYRINEGMTYNE